MVNECANDMKHANIVYSFGSDFSVYEVMWGLVFDIFSTIDQTFRKQFTLLNLFYQSFYFITCFLHGLHMAILFCLVEMSCTK